MKAEQRRDADVISVRDTPEQRQRTLDAAVASMLAALGSMGRRLDALLVKHEAAQQAQHLAALAAHLDQHTRRADFFDRAGRFRA